MAQGQANADMYGNIGNSITNGVQNYLFLDYLKNRGNGSASNGVGGAMGGNSPMGAQ